MTQADDALGKAIGEAVENALTQEGQAAKILAQVLPLSTSDHAIGWALLALVSETRAARLAVLDELGKITAALQTTATMAEQPRRRGGSW